MAVKDPTKDDWKFDPAPQKPQWKPKWATASQPQGMANPMQGNPLYNSPVNQYSNPPRQPVFTPPAFSTNPLQVNPLQVNPFGQPKPQWQYAINGTGAPNVAPANMQQARPNQVHPGIYGLSTQGNGAGMSFSTANPYPVPTAATKTNTAGSYGGASYAPTRWGNGGGGGGGGYSGGGNGYSNNWQSQFLSALARWNIE
jgi:hypothetical protein